MATLKEINYNIRNLLRGGILSDDERIAEKQMDFIIHSVRAMLIKQSIDKNQYIAPDVYQSTCIDLSIVDRSECPEIATDCVILRSTQKVPSILKASRGLAIMEIAAMDGSISYPLIALSRAKWRGAAKWTFAAKTAFIKNGYLYILNDIYQEKLSLVAIFNDPVEANSQSCSGITDEYPISTDMIDPLTTYILRNIMMLPMVLRTDELNDANGAVLNNVKGLNGQSAQAQEGN